MNDTVLRLQKDFRAIAYEMTGGTNPDLADDIVQEMSLAVLQCEPGKTDGYYRQRARWNARNYISRELRARRNERLPHSEDNRIMNASYNGFADVSDAYDQDDDFLAANLGWD